VEKGDVMTRKPLTRIISLIAKAAAPATAVATSLAAPLAQAASGDLDPSFADHGRVGPVATLKGSAYAVDALEDSGALFAGGIVERECRFSGWYCWYDYEYVASNFVSALTEDGGLDASYDGAQSGNIEVVDIARQPDGKVVAAGRRLTGFRGYPSHLVVFRLESDGSLDPGFGTDGIVELDAEATTATNMRRARCSSSRTAASWSRGTQMATHRLPPRTERRCRLLVRRRRTLHGCRVWLQQPHCAACLGRLSADDLARRTLPGPGTDGRRGPGPHYGQAGYAKVATGLGGKKTCHSIAAQDDDRLVIAGVDGGRLSRFACWRTARLTRSFSAPESPRASRKPLPWRSPMTARSSSAATA
jgi:uncharacterized delta-60 repeat protein